MLLAGQVTGELSAGHLRVTGLTDAQPPPQPQPVTVPAPDPDLQARFFPRAIVEQTQSGEFRQAISVFIGLQGSPTAAQVAQVVQNVFGLQAKYGGLLNRVDFGDKGCSQLMFWGAPVAHENDVARAGDGAWTPSEAALAAAPLPTNVRAVFIARLDRLAYEVREVAQTAAVLGREFEPRRPIEDRPARG